MSALERIEKLPDWPARMQAPVAAAYMGISIGSFLTRYRDKGVTEGVNVLWARVQLDRIIATQFNIKQPRGSADEDDATWDDLR